jgi:enamine deaminase RidA (YjgF/YER057c/UK114 family)
MPSGLRFISPSTLSKPFGYSHVVELTGPGRMIFIAGQVPLDRDGALVGPGDFRAQATQVFENLKLALADVGAGFEHVVKTTNFLADVSHRPILREVRDRYLNAAAPPASTLIGVTALAFPEWLVEIEAVAMVPER